MATLFCPFFAEWNTLRKNTAKAEEESFMKHWRKNEKKNYFILYTLLFAMIMTFSLSFFIINKKSMIWNGDGYKQHYQALVYFGRWGREILRNIFVRHTFEIPLWDFAIGYGSDILTAFHYYVIGDPLNLLSIAVPSAYTEYLYGILIVIRLYLAGISFSLYCFEMKKSRQAALVGTLNYVFCSFLICAAYTHPFFINPMIYLPLLLIGAERIFHKKKTVLFTVMVFVSAISNFYFFYTLAFAVCFYVVIRFFTPWNFIKAFIPISCCRGNGDNGCAWVLLRRLSWQFSFCSEKENNINF